MTHLNDEQRNVVEEKEDLLVIACPGSGKTRTLIYKIFHELQKIEETNRRVIAITFTNRAAEEINNRIEYLGINTKQLWIGTIHAFCLEWILRPYSGYSDRLKNGFSVIDEFTVEKMKEDICREVEADKYSLNTKPDRAGKFYNEGNAKIANRMYQDELVKNKYIDFDQIICLSYKMIQTYPKIASNLGSIFQIICIDEYQDTQDIAYGIIGEIRKNSTTKIFLVGDADQAIYTGLGGVAKEKEELEKEFGDMQVIQKTLNGCYRSNQKIIDFYSQFQLNTYPIIAKGKNSTEIGTIHFNKEIEKNEVYKYIADIVKNNLEKGIQPNEICIIAPRWDLIIPCGRQIATYLKGVDFDAPGLSPLGKSQDNIFFKIARLCLTEASPKMFNTRIKWAKEVITQLNENYNIQLDNLEARELLKIVNGIECSESLGIEYLKITLAKILEKLSICLNDNQGLVEQYNAFINRINERQKIEGIPKETEEFRKLFKSRTGIVINTCHGVKGEEFETVIAFGLLKGYIPNWSDIINNKDKGIDASKKLLYVICSRAKNNLYLIAERGYLTRNREPYHVNEELNSISYAYDDGL